MRARRGCLSLCLRAAIALALALAVAYAAFAIYASVTLNRRLDSLRAQGVKLKLSELAPQACSPDRNAAPIYEQAFGVMRSHQTETVAPGLERARPPVWPIAQMMAGFSPELAARARESVARHAQVLTLMHRAAQVPECVFPVDWTEGHNPAYRECNALEEIARLETQAAILAAWDGHPHAAADHLLDGINAAESLATSPGAQDTRQLVEVSMVSALASVLRAAPLSAADCRRLADRIAPIDYTAGHALAWEAERASGIAVYDRIRREGWTGYRMFGNAYSRRAQLHCLPPFRAVLNLDEALYLQAIDREISRSSRPSRERGPLRNPSGGLLWALPRTCAVGRIIAPSEPDSAAMRDTDTAILGLGQAALGLQAFRATYGAYPATLADVQAKLAWPLRKDPFSDALPVYRLLGGEHLLYSIGPDLSDGGGAVANGATDFGQGDIVWSDLRALPAGLPREPG
jgi:hypothetical protein